MKKKTIATFCLFIPLLILMIISLFNMQNAKLISDVYNDAFTKQIIWYILGLIFFIIVSKFDINKLFKYAIYIYIFNLFLLIAVLIFGKEINGARCWLNIIGFSFQPSELMKISLPFLLVTTLTKSNLKGIKKQLIFLAKVILLTLIPSVLVFLEPDTGAIISYLLILMIIIFSSKINKIFYFIALTLGILFIGLFVYLYLFNQDLLIKLIGTSFFYRVDRIINFSNGTGYQLENALINIGAAPLFNFNPHKITLYIPEAPTDFMFAFNIGNYGLLSGFLVLLCYFVIEIYILSSTKKIKRRKYKILVSTFNLLFIFQVLYNIGMNVGILPIMGIPLPFLSYGGTSLLISFILLGLIYNIYNKKVT